MRDAVTGDRIASRVGDDAAERIAEDLADDGHHREQTDHTRALLSADAIADDVAGRRRAATEARPGDDHRKQRERQRTEAEREGQHTGRGEQAPPPR